MYFALWNVYSEINIPYLILFELYSKRMTSNSEGEFGYIAPSQILWECVFQNYYTHPRGEVSFVSKVFITRYASFTHSSTWTFLFLR